MAESLHTPPVGLDGELIIIPFVLLFIFFLKSEKSGSYCLFLFVLTNTGFAPVTDTKSGKETQYGLKIITSSFI